MSIGCNFTKFETSGAKCWAAFSTSLCQSTCFWEPYLPFLSTSCQRPRCLQPLRQLPKVQMCGSVLTPPLAPLLALCNCLPSSPLTLLLLSAAEIGVSGLWTLAELMGSLHNTPHFCRFFFFLNLILFIFNRVCSQIYWAECNCLASLFCCNRSAGKFIKQ